MQEDRVLSHAQKDLESKSLTLQQTSDQLTQQWSLAEEERTAAEQQVRIPLID